MYPVRTILHPTDFSECSRTAFHLAGSIAKAEGARLIVLHVKQDPGPLVAYGQPMIALEPAECRDQLWEALRMFQLYDPRVEIEHRLVPGDAGHEIVQAAKETEADLIVMGTHGRTGLAHLVLGSVAEYVQRKAPCTVVTVRSRVGKKHQAEPARADVVGS